MAESDWAVDPVPDSIRSPMLDCGSHSLQKQRVGGTAIEVVKASNSTHPVMTLVLKNAPSDDIGNQVRPAKQVDGSRLEMTGAGRFRVCDLVIESNVRLPELQAAAGEIPDCLFKVLPAGTSFAGEFHWFHRWPSPDGGVWLSFAARGEDYLLRFPSQGDFLISGDGNEVQCCPLPGTPESTIRHLFLDQIVPLILSKRELLVLHASAILTPDGVIGFVGKSGQGKSTLAACFGQAGYPLISDDYLLLRRTSEDWMAVPSYPGVRLWPETSEGIFSDPPGTTEIAHYTAKRRVCDPALIPFADSPSFLRCLYFLDEGGERLAEPVIATLSPKDVFMKLVTYAFNLDIGDKALLKRQFGAIEHLSTRVPCFSLQYARDFSGLSAVRRLVVTHQTRSAV
jgi:hypothetical protein